MYQKNYYLFEERKKNQKKTKAVKPKAVKPKATKVKEVKPKEEKKVINKLLSNQNIDKIEFNDEVTNKNVERFKQETELSNLKKYLTDLNITGKRLSHVQTYTFKKLNEELIKKGYSANLSLAMCLLFFFESGFSGKKSINPITFAMGITQWIRNRFAQFVLFLRAKTQDFKSLKLSADTMHKLKYFLSITEANGLNINTNDFSLSFEEKAGKVTKPEIDEFNRILWDTKEMADYQIEFLMQELSSYINKKQEILDIDNALINKQNHSKNIFSKSKNKETASEIIDEETPENLINALNEKEKILLNYIISSYIIPNKEGKEWSTINNERIKTNFLNLYDNVIRKLDSYPLSDQMFVKDAENKDTSTFANKEEQIKQIREDIKKKIEEEINDYPFLERKHTVKSGETIAVIAKKTSNITWKSLIRYNLPFFIEYFKKRKNKKENIYNFASKFYGKIDATILIPKYNCIIVQSKEELQKVAEYDNMTVDELIAFNQSETKKVKKADSTDTETQIKHIIDPECRHTQIVFIKNKTQQTLSENILRKYIQELFLFEKTNNGNVNDMLLDKEGWITDPNDRKKIKQWYLDMGLAYK